VAIDKAHSFTQCAKRLAIYFITYPVPTSTAWLHMYCIWAQASCSGL